MNCFEELIKKKPNQPFFLHFVKNLKFLCRARSTVWMDVLIMLICNTFLEKKMPIKRCVTGKARQ